MQSQANRLIPSKLAETGIVLSLLARPGIISLSRSDYLVLLLLLLQQFGFRLHISVIGKVY